MMSSTTTEEANEAYWELDNRVVVQGQLFEAAEHVASVLTNRICAGGYSMHGLPRALDLLVELVYGESDQSEVALGNADLGLRCRAQVADGMQCVQNLVASEDERVVIGVLDLVDRLAPEGLARTAFLARLRTMDFPDAVRERLNELR